MTLEAIAKERGLTIETIVRHIAKYVRNGELSVTNFVDDKKIAAIQNAINNIPPNEGMKYIKDVCSIDVTYSDIIFVLANNERTK